VPYLAARSYVFSWATGKVKPEYLTMRTISMYAGRVYIFCQSGIFVGLAGGF